MHLLHAHGCEIVAKTGRTIPFRYSIFQDPSVFLHGLLLSQITSIFAEYRHL